jgi:ribose/xylose/arabinose/galactoside ABC-type transport system permease subunit
MKPSDASAGGWRLPRHELALVAAIVAVFVATGWLDPNHTYFANWAESRDIILRNASLLGIIALGAAVVIIAGGIDLSAGSMVAFSATTCALLLAVFSNVDDRRLVTVSGLGIAVAVGGALLSGLLVGTLHTWLITAIRLPPFVATLATLVGLRSFARAMCLFVTKERWGTESQQINVNTPFFAWIKEHNVWLSTGTFLVLALLTWVVLSRTVLGRHLYALGGNEQAARLSGIRTENVKWFAYCFGSLTAALAGIFLMADSSVAQPGNLARGYELNAIAAAVVGGCSLQGGVGTVTGTVLGAVFLRLVIDAVSKLIKASADVYEGMIVGIIVALAVTFTQVGQFAKAGHALFPGARGLAAIPTIAVFAGLLAMMAAANVDAFDGRTPLFGAVVGGGVLLALAAIRWMQGRRAA